MEIDEESADERRKRLQALAKERVSRLVNGKAVLPHSAQKNVSVHAKPENRSIERLLDTGRISLQIGNQTLYLEEIKDLSLARQRTFFLEVDGIHLDCSLQWGVGTACDRGNQERDSPNSNYDRLMSEFKAQEAKYNQERDGLKSNYDRLMSEFKAQEAKYNQERDSLKSNYDRLMSEFKAQEAKYNQERDGLKSNYDRLMSEFKAQEAKYNQERDSLKSNYDCLMSEFKAQEANQTAFLNRIRPIHDLDQEVLRLRINLAELRESYSKNKSRYDELIRAVAAFDEEVELAELGFYKPHFDFDSSERYKSAIHAVKEEQKMLVLSKNAIICHANWTMNNSRQNGETMTNRAIRLTARAFNNECDAAIARVRWNNVGRMELRIKKTFDAINKANKSLDISITGEYLNLKLKELRLAYEYSEKKREEREHKAELRRQEREEAKLREDAALAAKEEAKYAKLLAIAKEEAATAGAERLASLTAEIDQLTHLLAEAHAKNERAISMAEQTRSGYVYIVSNVGSFGDQVYKIGMTRRLDPMDRIRELSGASVPFVYDTHAIVYSEDAPTMETALHNAFETQRVNKVNSRKEFFKVTLEEVKREVERLFPEADFVETVEARDFKESRTIEERLNNACAKTDVLNRFPEEL